MDVLDLGIEGMTCASCVGRVERAIRRLPGVATVAVNLGTERVRVTGADVDAATLIAAIEKAGYGAHAIPEGGDADAEAAKRQETQRELIHAGIAAALTAPLLVAMILHVAGVSIALPGWVELVLATPVQFWLGARFYRAGWTAVRAHTGNMDLLVALGTSAAFFSASTCS